MERALGLITCSKEGLAAAEIEDLMSMDDDVLDDIFEWWLPPTRRMPPMLLKRLIGDLGGYLSHRGSAANITVMKWYHRQFNTTAKERYLGTEQLSMSVKNTLGKNLLDQTITAVNRKTRVHSVEENSPEWANALSKVLGYVDRQKERVSRTVLSPTDRPEIRANRALADYFSGNVPSGRQITKHTLWLSSSSKPNLRLLVELPYALIHAGLKQQCLSTLCSVEFMLAKIEGGLLSQLQEDFVSAMHHFPPSDHDDSTQTSQSLSFETHYRFLIKCRSYVISKRASFLQLALNTTGIVYKQAIAFIKKAKKNNKQLYEKYCCGLFFVWKNKDHEAAWLVSLDAINIEHAGSAARGLLKQRAAVDSLTYSFSENANSMVTAHANDGAGELSWWRVHAGIRRPLLGLNCPQIGSSISAKGNTIATFSAQDIHLFTVSEIDQSGQVEIMFASTKAFVGRDPNELSSHEPPDSLVAGAIRPTDGTYTGEEVIAVKSRLGDVKVLNISNHMAVLAHYKTPESQPAEISWSPNGRLLAVSCNKNSANSSWDKGSANRPDVVVYSMERGADHKLRECDICFSLGDWNEMYYAHITAMTWSLDSNILSICDNDGDIHMIGFDKSMASSATFAKPRHSAFKSGARKSDDPEWHEGHTALENIGEDKKLRGEHLQVSRTSDSPYPSCSRACKFQLPPSPADHWAPWPGRQAHEVVFVEPQRGHQHNIFIGDHHVLCCGLRAHDRRDFTWPGAAIRSLGG